MTNEATVTVIIATTMTYALVCAWAESMYGERTPLILRWPNMAWRWMRHGTPRQGVNYAQIERLERELGVGRPQERRAREEFKYLDRAYRESDTTNQLPKRGKTMYCIRITDSPGGEQTGDSIPHEEAAWLTREGPEGGPVGFIGRPWLILAEATVTDLQELPEYCDGHVDTRGVLWIEGTGYQLLKRG